MLDKVQKHLAEKYDLKDLSMDNRAIQKEVMLLRMILQDLGEDVTPVPHGSRVHESVWRDFRGMIDAEFLHVFHLVDGSLDDTMCRMIFHLIKGACRMGIDLDQALKARVRYDMLVGTDNDLEDRIESENT